MKVNDWCMYCGGCAGVCARNAIEVKEYSLNFNKDECNDCGFCMNACPVGAIKEE